MRLDETEFGDLHLAVEKSARRNFDIQLGSLGENGLGHAGGIENLDPLDHDAQVRPQFKPWSGLQHDLAARGRSYGLLKGGRKISGRVGCIERYKTRKCKPTEEKENNSNSPHRTPISSA